MNFISMNYNIQTKHTTALERVTDKVLNWNDDGQWPTSDFHRRLDVSKEHWAHPLLFPKLITDAQYEVLK